MRHLPKAQFMEHMWSGFVEARSSVRACMSAERRTLHEQEPEAVTEQPSAADAAVTVNPSEASAPASRVEAAERPASKAAARSTRAAAPAAKIRLGSK